MRTRGCWLIFLFLLALSFSVVVSGAPRTVQEIPVYAGAVRDQAAEAEILEQYEEFTDGSRYRSRTVRVYKAKALIDQVCKFYIDKLGAKPGASWEDPSDLEPGRASAVRYELGFYDDSIFQDQHEYDVLLWDGKWVRSACEKRPQWEKGRWLNQVWFEWRIMLHNGDLATYTVLLEDEGFDSSKKIDFQSTRIGIVEEVEKSEEAMDEEWDEEMDRQVEEKARQLAKNPPTEKTLGVPFYPGWIFSPEISAGMSLSDDFQIYVFFSNDTSDKVVDFYRQRLNTEPSSSEWGYLFALKGQLPIPDEGLSIQQNQLFVDFPPTMISVQKITR